MNALSPDLILGLSFALAFIFALIGQKTHFCTMGAVADIVNMGDWSRMRMWLLAIGVAILGAGSLELAGLIDLNKSLYRSGSLPWLSFTLGGFCFGFGMVLASGCGSKTLLRIGGGNLKSLVVLLVLGLTAYMTMRGLFGVWRVNLLDPWSIPLPQGADLTSLLRQAGVDGSLARGLAVYGCGGALVAWSLARRDFWTIDNLVGGLGSGLVIVAAWYVSGHLGYVAEHPETLQEAFLATNSGRMEAFTFVGPVAYTLEWLMLWSDSSRVLTVGITTVLGLLAGSLLWSLATRSFRWEGFGGVEDTANHLIGAALMGFGGVTALGCTIGQGLSGVSTLALGSFLALAAIIAGAVAALKFQYWRIMREA